MHFAFLTSASAPWGAETSLKLIAEGLTKQGSAVTVIAASDEVAEFLREGTTFVTIGTARERHSRIRRLVRFAVNALRVTSVGDVVVAFSVNLYPLVLLRLFGRRVVLDIHDSLREPRGRLIVGIFGRLANRNVEISRYIAGHYGLPRGRVVGRPVLIPPTSVLSLSGPLREIGIVGRLDPSKRIETAIAAVACLPGTRLRIYGEPFEDDGRYLASLKRLAERAAPGRVLFLGRKSRDELFGEVGTLIVANPDEASGRTVGEAMAYGVVVVVPDKGGAQEFFTDGASGFTWRTRDGARGLADALSRVLMEEVARDEVTSRARAAVEVERSVQRIATEYARACQ